MADDVSDAQVTADDLDKEQLTQLHNATLKASDTCFELKKLCATVLVPTATLAALFTDKALNAAVFGTSVLVIVAFWLADSSAYYYQRKLRGAMVPIWRRRAQRCAESYTTIPTSGTVTFYKAALNGSMVYYLILFVVVMLGLLLFECGVIHSFPPDKS